MKNSFKKSVFKKITGIILTWIFVFSMIFPFIGNTKVEAAKTTSNTKKTTDRIIVSMGDSYSSGEGVPEFYGQNLTLKERVTNHDWLAHRSKNAWSGQLVLDGVKMADKHNKNWYFVAASGAETKHINGEFKKDYYKIYDVVYNKEPLYTPGEKEDQFFYDPNDKYLHYDPTMNTPTVLKYDDYESLKPQIQIIKDLHDEGKSIDYITLTLGGNDAKFENIVTEAVLESTWNYFNPGGLAQKLNKVWSDFYKSGGIRDDLRKAYEDIANAAPEAKIIVAGYPKLMDKDGKELLFSKEAATAVNDSVSRFNDEIEMLVNSCKADGMKICFVSVEEEFERRGTTNCLNGIDLFANSEDIDDRDMVSPYSMHPNEEGIDAYRKCVQEKIDQIEADGGKSEWPTMSSSEERDIVMVLDASGSMDGTPLKETKKAAEKFINTVLKEDASIGVVSYDESAMKLADFCMNENYLKNVVQGINAGGGTNIEAGLSKAEEMLENSTAKKKIIVLMSDGEPNEGKLGSELTEYANRLKEKGILVYTLGFFNGLSNKSDAQELLQEIASDGCHFEVDDAQQLVFFFNDIADQIQGTKYIYVRIACPVDVSVTLNGETLSSRNADQSQRTSFGTLTFEENTHYVEDSSDNRIKVLRLREGIDYDVHIEGNGTGTMNFSMGFMDVDGTYSDMREFTDVKITPTTKIDTVAKKSKTSVMNIDEDGDGEYDEVLKVDGNGYIEDEEKETQNANNIIYIVCGAVAVISTLLLIFVIYRIKHPSVAKSTTQTKIVSKVINKPQKTIASAVKNEYCFCEQCGQKLNIDDRFCPECGATNKK